MYEYFVILTLSNGMEMRTFADTVNLPIGSRTRDFLNHARSQFDSDFRDGAVVFFQISATTPGGALR